MDKKVSQIFTFGSGQKYENMYIKIFGKTKEECRKKMFEMFSNKWSRQYDSEEKAGVYYFNLKELKV